MQSDPQRYHRPTVGPEGCRGGAMGSNGATHWVERFLDDLGVIPSANTVRAYRQDLVRWVAFCASRGVGPLRGDPERCGGVHRPRAAAADPAAGCGVSRRSASGTTSWRWSLSGRAWLAIRCPPGRPSGRRRPRPPATGPAGLRPRPAAGARRGGDRALRGAPDGDAVPRSGDRGAAEGRRLPHHPISPVSWSRSGKPGPPPVQIGVGVLHLTGVITVEPPPRGG